MIVALLSFRQKDPRLSSEIFLRLQLPYRRSCVTHRKCLLAGFLHDFSMGASTKIIVKYFVINVACLRQIFYSPNTSSCSFVKVYTVIISCSIRLVGFIRTQHKPSRDGTLWLYTHESFYFHPHEYFRSNKIKIDRNIERESSNMYGIYVQRKIIINFEIRK